MVDLFVGIDLNDSPLEHGDGNAGFDLNEPPLEHGNDNASLISFLLRRILFELFIIVSFLYVIASHIIVSFWIGFELNLPLDEYGAINLDFEEKPCRQDFFYMKLCW